MDVEPVAALEPFLFRPSPSPSPSARDRTSAATPTMKRTTFLFSHAHLALAGAGLNCAASINVGCAGQGNAVMSANYVKQATVQMRHSCRADLAVVVCHVPTLRKSANLMVGDSNPTGVVQSLPMSRTKRGFSRSQRIWHLDGSTARTYHATKLIARSGTTT